MDDSIFGLIIQLKYPNVFKTLVLQFSEAALFVSDMKFVGFIYLTNEKYVKYVELYAACKLAPGDITLYENRFDFNSFSSEKRVKYHKNLILKKNLF